MLFAIALGLVLGAAGALLIEQWLRGELSAAPRRAQPRISHVTGVFAPPHRRRTLR